MTLFGWVEVVEADGILTKYSLLASGRVAVYEHSGNSQPSAIGSRGRQHGPIASPYHAIRAETPKDVRNKITKCRGVCSRRCLGQKTGQLAVHVSVACESFEVRGPAVVVGTGNVRFARVIKDSS